MRLPRPRRARVTAADRELGRLAADAFILIVAGLVMGIPAAQLIAGEPPPWDLVHEGDCDGCARTTEVAPVGEVQLCIRCLRKAMWLDDDVHGEAAEFYEGKVR